MITIFTPAYNRAHTLGKLYESLKRQSSHNFEWLVIDDGSKDGTQELFKTWLEQRNPFKITYIKTENGGKHKAINLGVSKAGGEAFFIVDSDDFLPPDSVEKIEKAFSSVVDNERFAGICGLKAGAFDKQPLGNSAASAGLDCSMADIRYKYHIRGDMAEVFKTSVLRQYPFPVFEGEKFMNEAVVWGEIAKKHLMRYTGDILYYCEYMPDGLTRSIRRQYRRSPKGTKLYYGRLIKDSSIPLKERAKAGVLYWRYLCFNGEGYKNMPLFSAIFWPAGVFFYFMDCFRGVK